MRAWSLFLCGGLLLSACDDDGDATEELAARQQPKQVMKIDKRAKAGRMFMYLDDGGNVVRTADYDAIPAKHRGAVVVTEGRKRSRVKRTQAGKLEITSLPPKISASEREGAKAGEQLLKEHPPEAGPPSTESWSNEQWREEIKRELEELKREQEKE
jgi:hypothetical protein